MLIDINTAYIQQTCLWTNLIMSKITFFVKLDIIRENNSSKPDFSQISISVVLFEIS